MGTVINVFWKHFIKKIVEDMTSASQWKRCLTNPNSWMKLNIFSALLLDLESADSLHTYVQRRSTPHLSVLHTEEQPQWFSCKNAVAFWLCQVWHKKRAGLPAALPTGREVSVAWAGSLAFPLGTAARQKDLTQLLTVQWAISLWSSPVLLKQMSGLQQRLHPAQGCFLKTPGSCTHTEQAAIEQRQRGTSPQHPPAPPHRHARLALICRQEVQCQVSSQYRNFQHHLTVQRENRTSFSLRWPGRNPKGTTATRKYCSILLLKKSTCLPLRRCRSAAKWRFAGSFCPSSYRNTFYRFPRSPSYSIRPSRRESVL